MADNMETKYFFPFLIILLSLLVGNPMNQSEIE